MVADTIRPVFQEFLFEISMLLLSSKISRLISVVAFAMFSTVSIAEDWSQFRGPLGNAISAEVPTPVDFSEARTVWATEIPGTGWSSPVVAGGHIWLTTAEPTEATPEEVAKKVKGVQFAKIKTTAGQVKLRAICVDAATGRIVHNVLLRDVSDPDLINPLNSYASPTPAIAGDRVICNFGSYGTWCLNAKTAVAVWDTALVIDHSVGPGSSPVIVGNTVILVCDGIDKQFVAGLDLESGDEKWRTSRPEMRTDNGEFRKAYSTPLLVSVDGRIQAVIPGAQWMCAYDPANGKEIWRADCGNGFSTTPMAIYDSGLVVCSTGFMSPELVAVNPEGQGDVTADIVWKSKQGGSTMPTAVASNGLMYSISDKGILSVLNTVTGEMTSRQRIGGKFAASPLLVGDNLYLPSQEGIMTVIDKTTMKVIARNKMDGALMASPAVLGSDLVIRTSKSLVRLAQ